MKGLKKLLTGILTGAMALTMVLSADSANVAKAAGDGSVTVNNAIEGEVYTLYKLLDFESSGANSGIYTISTSSPWYGFFSSEAGTDGVITLTQVTGDATKYYVSWKAGAVTTDESRAEALADTAGIQAFAKRAIKYGQDNGLGVGTATADSTKKVTFSNLDLGYYLVGSSAGSLVALDTTNTAAEVNEKNDIPSTEKKVEEDSSGLYGDKDDADIGQVVNYRSTVTIPAGGAKNVKFEDEMTASLDLIASSITLKIGDDVVVAGADTYAVTETTDHGFKITFADKYTEETLKAGAVIKVEYSATLNANAIIYGKETSNEWGGGNDNRSRITYGNAGESEWDWTRTYTYPLDLKKVDFNDNTKVLPGAKFTLGLTSDYETVNNVLQLKEGKSLIGLTLVSAGDANNAAVYKVGGEVTEMVTPESGMIVVEGLDADIYNLIETEAPAGYNKLDAPIVVTIASNTGTAEGQGDNNTSQTTISVSRKNGSADYTGTLTIGNKTGAILPSTGGIGTTIFYIVGALLICAAVVFMIMKRKGAQAE